MSNSYILVAPQSAHCRDPSVAIVSLVRAGSSGLFEL